MCVFRELLTNERNSLKVCVSGSPGNVAQLVLTEIYVHAHIPTNHAQISASIFQ